MRFPGDRIGGWVLGERIGQGAVGEVWSASRPGDPAGTPPSAIKMLKTNSFDAPKERFEREIEALTRVEHPNIVRIREWGDAPVNDAPDTTLYFVMELLQGISLGERLRRGPMVAAEVVATLIPVARALAYVHELGITHRDVKPQNILICWDGFVRLIDFGLAHDDEKSRLTAIGSIAGSTRYLPPEFFDMTETDLRQGDIYALGVVLYEALLHQPAYAGDEPMTRTTARKQILADKRTHALDPGADFYDDLRQLVRKATAPNPANRLQSMAAFVSQLEAVDVEPFDPDGPTDTHEIPLPRPSLPPPKAPNPEPREAIEPRKSPATGTERPRTPPVPERRKSQSTATPVSREQGVVVQNTMVFAVVGVAAGLLLLGLLLMWVL